MFDSASGSLSPNQAKRTPHYVEVLVDCKGTQKLFTYCIPMGWQVAPGDILSVPFGPQTLGGIAIRCHGECPPELDPLKLREIVDIVSPSLFPSGYWRLLEQVAHYYQAPMMAVIRVALPPGLLLRSQRRIRITTAATANLPGLTPTAQQLMTLLQQSQTQDYAWSYLQRHIPSARRGLQELQQRGWVESYLQTKTPAQPKRQRVITLLGIQGGDLSPRHQELLTILRQQGGEMWLQDFLKLCRTSAQTARTLATKGYVALTEQERLRLETTPIHRDSPRSLTPDQAQALSQLQSLHHYTEVLLHGVTGSGKTEVYLQALAPILAQGKSAIVLVPEIGLTPQLTDRLRARFGACVRVYHSALSEGERYDTWRQCLTSEPQIVVGTRSAIFAPLPHLGLIILDEEHDSGYKQDQPAPCYHARTVAQWRAALTDCPLVLGSATPSLESWSAAQQALSGAAPALYLNLPQRVHAQPLPPIELVDMRQELRNGNRSMFSRKLQVGLQTLVDSQQQGLLFVHRRGHSTFVSCRSCGYVMGCPHCSVSLTYHHTQAQQQSRLRCHYCNYACQQPQHCPECQSPYFRFFGQGTQKVMEALQTEYPNLRVLRFDSDTTRRKGAHRHLLERFAAGEADLMVGTQMLTKGIDLPQVQFVGVLAADSLLNLSDFRASERTFQTLLQVAGRSGRGTEPGQVVMQTYNPDHPVLLAVQKHDFAGLVTEELQHRSMLQYPPFAQLTLLRLSSLDAALVEQTAQKLAQILQTTLETQNIPGEILGPAPAAILRVAQRYRWHILLKLPLNSADGPASWRVPLDELRSHCSQTIRLTVDVDPLNIL